jgi:hypothetical protein
VPDDPRGPKKRLATDQPDVLTNLVTRSGPASTTKSVPASNSQNRNLVLPVDRIEINEVWLFQVGSAQDGITPPVIEKEKLKE